MIPENIIIRSLQKTATAEEEAQLNEWLNEDPQHIAHYFQLEEIWNARKELPRETIRQGWEKLHEAIATQPWQNPKPFIPRKSSSSLWLRYAAAVFAGILIASAIWMNFPAGTDELPPQEMIVQHVVHNSTGVQSIQLPDQSEIWLNENSKLVYPDQFTGKQREVTLEGRAFFDIRKNKNQPFIVHAGTINVEVTGTEFFIESLSIAETSVTLISGGVNISYADEKNERVSEMLIPGQQAVIQSGKLNIVETDKNYYLAWKDGVYRFKDEPLENIAAMIEKRFGLQIRMADSLRKKRFTGRIASEEEVEDVFRTFNKSYPLEYKITGKSITIHE